MYAIPSRALDRDRLDVPRSACAQIPQGGRLRTLAPEQLLFGGTAEGAAHKVLAVA
jgi:hypothetical protein